MTSEPTEQFMGKFTEEFVDVFRERLAGQGRTAGQAPEVVTDATLLKNIIWEDAEGYLLVNEIRGGSSRWHIHIVTVFRRLSDGKQFMAAWRRGATEQQEHEYPDEAVECESYVVQETRYRPVGWKDRAPMKFRAEAPAHAK